MRGFLILLTATGCRLGFDAPPPLDVVAHVPSNVELAGTGVLEIGDGTIDTDALTVNGASLTGGGQMIVSAQDAGGPELALLDAFRVRITGDVRVVGTRALVITAQLVDVYGTLDVSANGPVPGPGASDDSMSIGRAGRHIGDVNDTGGGGGGHGTDGALGGGSGGNAGGAGGQPLGDPALTILVGGAHGGAGSGAVCGNPPGGGGGGAVQLTAGTRITIGTTGRVLAGGGGGGGGLECMSTDAGSAGGGGAGGAIFLSAPTLVLDGEVLAHGGGGGGGGNGSTGNGPVGSGMRGTDGRTVDPAPGGLAAAATSGAGGAGGAGDIGPAASVDVMHNGGGGGGAVGRVVVTGQRAGSGIVSPTPHTTDQ